jgi:hypothetical protein
MKSARMREKSSLVADRSGSPYSFASPISRSSLAAS